MYRKDAIENRRIKWRGRAILLPGFPLWLTILVCVFFLTFFLAFIITGSYTRQVNISGEIATWPRAVNIYSSEQGFVVKQFVTEGQIINKGDPVYQLDVSRSTRSGVVSDNQKEDIESQIIRIKNIISRLEENKKTTIRALEEQKAQYDSAFKRSTDILNKAEEGLMLMKHNMDNYRGYQLKGLINKDQLTNMMAVYYQQQSSFLSLSGQNEYNALQITSLESQIQTQATEFDNNIYQMELKLYDLQKERVNVDLSGDVIIRAMSDGKVDSLSVTVGQMVNAGDSLLQIVPAKIEHYYLVSWVTNNAIPYIKTGDRVNIRYDAFPSAKFGQFPAKIALISKTPASPQEMQTYPGAPKDRQELAIPYYKTIIKPDKNVINYDGKTMQLENGMKATITLFLEKRKIYQWMLSPFYDMKQSTVGPIHER